MIFYRFSDAQYFARSQPYPDKHKAVKTRHWSVDDWDWRECWTVVYQP